MAFTKQTKIDQIEVVENGTVQVRQATIITDNGNQVSRTYHRWCISPGEDYSAQEQQTIINELKTRIEALESK